MDFEFIDEGDIESVKRGRKSTVPAELVELLGKVPAGKAVALRELAGNPSDEGYKSYKASTSAMLRQAGKLAGVKVTIAWSPAGVPQVRLTNKPAKPARSK